LGLEIPDFCVGGRASRYRFQSPLVATYKTSYQAGDAKMTLAVSTTGHLAIFAYGSLLFRPGFEYVERRPAIAPGYARSFRQASPDHRGTHESPGRVVTLQAVAGASCAGALYWVAEPTERLLAELDHRERAGYERIRLSVQCDGLGIDAVTWLAPAGNPYDAGELQLAELASLIRAAAGPSGRNDEYVYLLERALLELGVVDPLVSDLAALLRA
jgi:cation transport regulator ChaC